MTHAARSRYYPFSSHWPPRLLALAADAWLSRWAAIVVRVRRSARGRDRGGGIRGEQTATCSEASQLGAAYSALQTVVLRVAGARACSAGRRNSSVIRKGGQLAALVGPDRGSGSRRGGVVRPGGDSLIALEIARAGRLRARRGCGRHAGASEAAVEVLRPGRGRDRPSSCYGLGAYSWACTAAPRRWSASSAPASSSRHPGARRHGSRRAPRSRSRLGAFPFHSWAPDAYETRRHRSRRSSRRRPKLGGARAAACSSLTRRLGGQLAVLRFRSWSRLSAASIVFGNLGGAAAASLRADARRTRASRRSATRSSPLGGRREPHTGGRSSAASYALAASGAFLGAEAVARVRPDWDGSHRAGWPGSASARRGSPPASRCCLLSLTGIPLTARVLGQAAGVRRGRSCRRVAMQDRGVARLAVVGGCSARSCRSATTAASCGPCTSTSRGRRRRRRRSGIEEPELLAARSEDRRVAGEDRAPRGIAGRSWWSCAIAARPGAAWLLAGHGAQAFAAGPVRRTDRRSRSRGYVGSCTQYGYLRTVAHELGSMSLGALHANATPLPLSLKVPALGLPLFWGPFSAIESVLSAGRPRRRIALPHAVRRGGPRSAACDPCHNVRANRIELRKVA